MHGRLQNCPDTFLQNLTYLTLRIFHIPESSCPSRTGLYAGRESPLFHSVMTPGAFIRFFNLVVDESGAIGTGLNAISTTKAIIMIHQHESLGGFVRCADWANLHAGWVLAVVTHFWHKKGLFCFFLKLGTDWFKPLFTTIG